VAFIGDLDLEDAGLGELAANEPSFSASAMNGFSFGGLFRGDEGKLTAFEIAPVSR